MFFSWGWHSGAGVILHKSRHCTNQVPNSLFRNGMTGVASVVRTAVGKRTRGEEQLWLMAPHKSRIQGLT